MESAFSLRNRPREMIDDAWSYITRLCDSDSLVTMRELSHYHSTFVDREIDRRRKFGSISLTVTQFAAFAHFTSSKKRVLTVRADSPGFGLKVLATACASQFKSFTLYLDKGSRKAYAGYLREMSLLEASKQVGKDKSSHTTVRLSTHAMDPEFSCLVVDSNASVWPAPGNTPDYSHVIVIVRDRENAPKNTVYVPTRHSFTLKPVSQWVISEQDDNVGCFNAVLELLKVHRKLLVITDREETLAMKAPEGCTRETHYRNLSKDKKNRQLCFSKTKQKRQERLEAEAILVESSPGWQYKDIVQLVSHVDTARETFRLHVFSWSALWEYARVQSFRPWQLACWPNWLISDPREEVVERVVLLSLSLPDSADKCVVCCRGNYFTGRRRDILLEWWTTNKGPQSTGDFAGLHKLSFGYEA